MENTLIINSDLRTVVIPDGIKNLGVEHDDDVLQLHFSMPKMYGAIDLSAFNIRINYMNANNEGDVYPVVDNHADGDNIAFSWLVSRNVTAYKGNVRFIVCLRELDEAGDVSREFNTTPASLPVLEGLETTSMVVQQNPDILEHILLRLDALEQNGTGGGGGPAKDADMVITFDENLNCSHSFREIWNALQGGRIVKYIRYYGDMTDMRTCGFVGCRFAGNDENELWAGNLYTSDQMAGWGDYEYVQNDNPHFAIYRQSLRVDRLEDDIGDISTALNSTVKSVNGQTPDGNGNVQIETGGGGSPMLMVEISRDEGGNAMWNSSNSEILDAIIRGVPICATYIDYGEFSYSMTSMVCHDSMGNTRFEFPYVTVDILGDIDIVIQSK